MTLRKYLSDLLASGTTFTVDISGCDRSFYARRGVLAIDATGIVVDEPETRDSVALPWTAIVSIKIEEC